MKAARLQAWSAGAVVVVAVVSRVEVMVLPFEEAVCGQSCWWVWGEVLVGKGKGYTCEETSVESQHR